MRLVRKWLLMGVVACGLAGPSTVRADFMSDFTGNTQMSEVATSAGVVSFSVFENTGGGSWIDAINTKLGLAGAAKLKASAITGGNALDTTAAYVYMFQVVNIGTAADLEVLKVRGPAGFSSAGNLTNSAGTPASVVFSDAAGQVHNATTVPVTAANRGLGVNPTKDDIVDGAPSSKGATVSTISAYSGARKAATSNLSTGGNLGFVYFSFDSSGVTKSTTGNNNAHTSTSTIVFLTSASKPTFYNDGRVRDGSDSDGDLPVASTPEPSSFAMAGIGLIGGLGLYYRRRRTLVAVAA